MKSISAQKQEWLLHQIDLLTQKGLSKAEIARKTDVMPQYLNSILSGARGITDAFLDKFCEAFNINQFDLYSLKKEKTLTIEDKLLNIISEKDKTITEQAEKIGRLEAEIEHLKRETAGQLDAEVAGVAGVG